LYIHKKGNNYGRKDRWIRQKRARARKEGTDERVDKE